MFRKFPCVLFCHTYDAFNFPLSHPGSGRGLCVSFLTPTQIDPRVDMGRTRERFFRGGAVDFMILNVHPSIQSFPEYKFSSPDSETEMKKVDFFEFETES